MLPRSLGITLARPSLAGLAKRLVDTRISDVFFCILGLNSLPDSTTGTSVASTRRACLQRAYSSALMVSQHMSERSMPAMWVALLLLVAVADAFHCTGLSLRNSFRNCAIRMTQDPPPAKLALPKVKHVSEILSLSRSLLISLCTCHRLSLFSCIWNLSCMLCVHVLSACVQGMKCASCRTLTGQACVCVASEYRLRDVSNRTGQVGSRPSEQQAVGHIS